MPKSDFDALKNSLADVHRFDPAVQNTIREAFRHGFAKQDFVMLAASALSFFASLLTMEKKRRLYA